MSFGNNCPRFVKEFNGLKDLPEIQKFNENHQELYNYLREHTGLNLTDEIYGTSNIYDILLVEVIRIYNNITYHVYLSQYIITKT